MLLDLYRIKVFRRSLFSLEFVPSEVLDAAVNERPTSRPSHGVRWHIGNVERIDHHGIYFRLGRQSRATLPSLDARGNFVESEFESAPYTHGLLDVRLGLCAFARNTALAQSTSTVAHRLHAVLDQSRAVNDVDGVVRIGPVKDPAQFLEILGAAYSIRSFSFTYQRRNPFDANRDFIQPFERFIGAANGASGQTTVKGRDLAAQPLEEITRSVAATGDEAKARVQIAPEAKPVVRTLRGDNASVGVDSLDTAEKRAEALTAVRGEHGRIRGAHE